ncbi:hypothetical protein ACBY01_13450 [Sphingomonas sp. ac-8]|uniref:F0F1 ATP synthase subunit B family protein n=1 Tax=Sphingomonas sp. ac-8 TaxID=3242977 RepID=UPI003A811EDF
MANANGSSIVAERLDHAAALEPLEKTPIRGRDGLPAEPLHGTAVADEHHAVSPTAWGMDSTGWVAVAALLTILLLVWRRAHKGIAGTLDARIATIRSQLDEAKRLRAEAEALKAEYASKATEAEAEAAAMREHAHAEAAAIVAKAEADAEELTQRRARMAEDRIAAAERQAIAEVRAKAADAATKAAAVLIADRLDSQGDRALIDRTIAGLGTGASRPH